MDDVPIYVPPVSTISIERGEFMDLDLPDIARGVVIPDGIQELWLKEAKAKEALRQQRRHDFRIATYGIIGGIIGGIISGVASSLIVLKLQGVL